jgi:hypothetical protein
MSHMLSERAPRRGTEARRAASWRQLPPERKCTGIAQNCKEHIHKKHPSHCIPRAPSDCPAGRRTAGTGCTERAFSTRVSGGSYINGIAQRSKLHHTLAPYGPPKSALRTPRSRSSLCCHPSLDPSTVQVSSQVTADSEERVLRRVTSRMTTKVVISS